MNTEYIANLVNCAFDETLCAADEIINCVEINELSNIWSITTQRTCQAMGLGLGLGLGLHWPNAQRVLSKWTYNTSLHFQLNIKGLDVNIGDVPL